MLALIRAKLEHRAEPRDVTHSSRRASSTIVGHVARQSIQNAGRLAHPKGCPKLVRTGRVVKAVVEL